MLLFGENNSIIYGYNTKYDIIKWLLYILYTIIMNTLLLNLLIAIISDAFERVLST